MLSWVVVVAYDLVIERPLPGPEHQVLDRVEHARARVALGRPEGGPDAVRPHLPEEDGLDLHLSVAQGREGERPDALEVRREGHMKPRAFLN